MWRLVVGLPLASSEYCNAGNTVQGDTNLGRVALVGAGGTSIDEDSNCPGSTGVQDFTYLNASLAPGETYTLNFQATTCDAGWARLAYAFIDFNGNQVYDESELLGQINLDNRVAPFDISFPFTVPCLDAGSVAGTTRMRVFVVESGFNPNPCLTFSYGGVKEFSINILNQACGIHAYCKAGNTVAQGSNLGAVSMLGLLRTYIQDDTNCPGGTGVRDFTKLSTSVMPGGSYLLNVDVTTCNGKGYTRLVYAYIDWNNNGVFDNYELAGMTEVGNDASPVEITFPVWVPCDAVVGKTRLRVLVAEGAHDPDPCLVYAYGGVKEYSITVLSQLDKPCLPPVRYCKAGSVQAGDSNLGPVTLEGVQGTAINDTSNCPNRPGIQDLTQLSASLQPGGDYKLSFDVTTCGLGWARAAYAFIDFNANSVFEPSEALGTVVVNGQVAPVPVTFSFTVPCVGNGAIVGTTRLRVLVVEGDGVTNDPCALFSYGAVKEFSVKILDKPTKMCSSPL